MEVPILKPTTQKRHRKELDPSSSSFTQKPLVETRVTNGPRNGTESGGIIEFGQETVSILAIVGVCIFLAIANVIVWLCGCRRHAKRNEEERQDQQLERDRFNDKQQRGGGTPYSKKKKVADKTSIMKKGDTGKDEKVIEDGERDHPRLETKINASETIEEFEARVRDQFSRANVLNEIKEEEIPTSIQSGKNKRVEEIALELSVESLQRSESKAGQIDEKSLNEKNHNRPEKAPFHRNDSKVNVFNTDRIEEIDLNPALNNSINLETI